MCAGVRTERIASRRSCPRLTYATDVRTDCEYYWSALGPLTIFPKLAGLINAANYEHPFLCLGKCSKGSFADLMIRVSSL